MRCFDFLAHAVRAKEIFSILARNGFADLLQQAGAPTRARYAAGTRKWNSVPLPGMLEQAMLPPCATTISRAMASPIPAPGFVCPCTR